MDTPFQPIDNALASAREKRRMALKRREFERHAFRLPVAVRWEGGEAETTSRTLGLGGVFLALADAPPVGTAVELTLTLVHRHTREAVALRGEVVYADSRGAGVKFLGTPAAVRAKLRAFFLLQDLHCYPTEGGRRS